MVAMVAYQTLKSEQWSKPPVNMELVDFILDQGWAN